MTDIAMAVEILRKGGLVAFPTETVYGLGADAANAEAVRKIYLAKGRPPANPLIVHVSDAAAARQWAVAWPPAAQALAARFWPGPLTLVVRRGPGLSALVGAGRDTVGLRCPNHPMALELLTNFAGPIAAPSANRSNRISPTTAEHVRAELGGAVDLILDGGPCRVGIESTVLDVNSASPCILRPGSISRRQIEEVIGPVAVFAGAATLNEPALSPGQHAVHYAPSVPAYRFSRGDLSTLVRWRENHSAAQCGLLRLAHSAAADDALLQAIRFARVLSLPEDPSIYAHRLYAALRELDVPETDAIFAELPPDDSSWAAVRDRLMRATRPIE